MFIQTALTADELLPLALEPAFEKGYRKVVYHRRGYENSSPVKGPGSIIRDAADCAALLGAMGIEKTHIVGTSYSGAIGLQLATDSPSSVHTLTLIEPPPVHTPSSPQFRALNVQLIQTRREKGPETAFDEFFTALFGPEWRKVVETHLPAEWIAQAERDMLTFLDSDLPALLDWDYSSEDAGRIQCPVLHVGGSDSGQFFAEVRDLILDWLPHAEDIVVEGAGHSLAFTHTPEVANAIAGFVGKHPV